MNAPLPAVVSVNIPSLQMAESELCAVLQNSIYPGAKLESVKLVIGYCRAGQLDPLQKPVHIVPMDVPTGKKDSDGWDIKEKRDVVMPGVGLYRIQAARTGDFAGMTEPEFGEDVTEKLGDTEITYPKSCKVTVRRLVRGQIVEFTAKELWKENYATKGRNKKDPNAMWMKRPYAQLAKCAEAQALRKGFPEFVGSAATAEEMEGKPLDDGAIIEATVIQQPQSKSSQAEQPGKTAEPGAAVLPAAADQPGAKAEGEKKDDKPLQGGQKRILAAKLKNAGLSDADLKAVFGRTLDEDGWLFSDFEKVQKFITERSSRQ